MLTGLTRKVTLAAIVFLVLIALVAAFVLLSIDAMQEASALLTNEVVPQLDAKGDFTTSMTHALGELETFTYSHHAADLADVHEAVDEAQGALERLGAEATDADESGDPADVAATQRLLEHATVLLATAQRLLADTSAPNAKLGSETVEGIEQAHTDLANLEEEGDTALERQHTTVTGSVATSLQAVFVGAVALGLLCVALVLLALFVLRRAIVQPIVTLATTAEQVASGDLEQSVPATGPDEIGALQRSFNTMVATLDQRTQQLQQQLETATAAQASAEAARTELAEQLRTIEEQRSVIREMSVPILPLSDRAVVMPLIGTLDTARLQLALDRALHVIEQRAARYALLDITGVPLIDTQVARGLLHIVEAARLLGAEVVMVGIRPEVAQSMVGLGLQLNGITVRSTLQDGISYVLAQR